MEPPCDRSVGLWIRKNGAPSFAAAMSALLAMVKLSGEEPWSWGAVLMPLWLPPLAVIVIWGAGMVQARLVCVVQDALLPPPRPPEGPRTGRTADSVLPVERI